MNRIHPKISIIGGGNVGIRYAYALLIKGIARQIVIVDINKTKLKGEVMDLNHGIPFVSPSNIIAGNYEDIINSDLVVITAGRKQKVGDSRLDLIQGNLQLFKEILPEIKQNAPSAIYLVVTNPVDILSYITYKLTNKPANEVIGSGTVLDSARFRYLLSTYCDIDARNIHGYILGEHGDSEFAVWSKVMIGGLPIEKFLASCDYSINRNPQEDLNQILLDVRESAYEIIRTKGETSYGIGLSLLRITEAILNNENSILPVSCLIDGFLGIKDVYLSLPAVLNKKGIKKILELDLNDQEKTAFRHSANSLQTIIQQLNL